MRRLLLCLAALACFAGLAGATTVQYSTDTSELCIGAAGCGLTSFTDGNITISFSSLVDQMVDAPTQVSLGSLVTSCNAGGTACDGSVLPADLNLYLNITQTLPTVGSGSIPVASLAGTISGTSSSAKVTWASGKTVFIDPVTYTVITDAKNQRSIVPPSSNQGVSSIEAQIVAPIPEPSTYGLIASGLLGLGFLARRRASK